MLFFKNSELASKYKISLGTVRNWIEAAQGGKIKLALYEKGDRAYIANTPENVVLIEHFVEERRKYRNSRAVKEIQPSDEFYKLFSPEQVYDIIKSLEVYREIPRDYNYFDSGADSWLSYVERLSSQEVPNLLNQTIRMLSNNQEYLDKLLSEYSRINIIDIGVGNAMPVKKLIGHLRNIGKMGRYIAADISPDMIEIARENIKRWFNDEVSFEAVTLDIKKDRFSPIMYQEYMEKESKGIANIILLLGGTLSNFDDPDAVLHVIRESMGVNDYFIHTQLLDTDKSRNNFGNNDAPVSSPILAQKYRLIFDLFNIDDSYYEVEMGFDKEHNERYIQTRLKVALNITFKNEAGERTVSLNKGDVILLWRHRHLKALDVVKMFDKNGFHLLQTQQTEDKEYILTVSKVR